MAAEGAPERHPTPSKPIMASADDPAQSLISDPLVGTDLKGRRVLYTGNKAHIEGTLHELSLFQERTGTMSAYFEHGAATLKGGALAVDNPTAVLFLNGTVIDPRSFMNPPPPTLERLAEVNAARAAAVPAPPAEKPLTAVPDADKSTVMVAPFHCKLE